MKKIKDPKRLAKEFQAWRERNKLTVEEFARRLGVHYSTVMKWDQGENTPSEFFSRTLKPKFPDCPLFH